MARIGYNYQGEEKGTARAIARGVRASPKQAYEVANAIRGLKINRAIAFLTNVTNKKEAVPYRRFNRGVGHRKEIGPGRYPVKTSGYFLKLLNEVSSNAEFRGLNTDNLVVKHVATHRGEIIQGRYKGSAHNTPTTHIELVVAEGKEKKEVKQKQNGSREEVHK